MGERKMINVDGDRFVFLNNGQAFDETFLQLGDEIGAHSNGTLYKLNNYNSSFRMAFKYENAYYIVENVGKSDDSKMDITTYLEAANLESQVLYADVFDHIGGAIMNGLSAEEAVKVLNAYKNATVADLETSDYEAIAKAQAEGQSYQLVFTLEDHTSFTSYVIPSMGYVTIGDYTCVLEDLDTQIGEFFKDLTMPENIIMN